MCKIVLFKLRGWRKPYHLFWLDLYPIQAEIAMSTDLQCFTLIKTMVLVLSLYWDCFKPLLGLSA